MNLDEILVTSKAKMNLIKGIIRVAKSDGVLDDNEWYFYQQTAKSFNLSNDDLLTLQKAWESNSRIVIEFESNREKLFFFIQAIQLCWIDGDYSDEEKKEIRDIAYELNISDNSINEIENWVYEGIQWNKKSDRLLDLE